MTTTTTTTRTTRDDYDVNDGDAAAADDGDNGGHDDGSLTAATSTINVICVGVDVYDLTLTRSLVFSPSSS
jgi:hypothetical protein